MGKGTNKLGRPTKYLPEVIYPQVEEYISSCGREATELPTIEGLAIHLGVNPDTLYTWSKEYPDFSETLKKLLATQKKQLINDGMYGGKEVNATMAIFLLKVNHGMKDDSGIKVQVNNMLPILGGASAKTIDAEVIEDVPSDDSD